MASKKPSGSNGEGRTPKYGYVPVEIPQPKVRELNPSYTYKPDYDLYDPNDRPSPKPNPYQAG